MLAPRSTTLMASAEENCGSNLVASIATSPQQVIAAQKLRYEIFSSEYGADLGATENPGIDADRFDDYCEHLLVTDKLTGAIVATTRILHADAAKTIGGFYSEQEFDLSQLKSAPGTFAELGRTCVSEAYRNGATLNLLWAQVAHYLMAENIDFMIGCASISMQDGGYKAWRVAQRLQQDYLAEAAFRVWPKRALPHLTNLSDEKQKTDIPPLIRAYMRLGAKVCGQPCWDPDFRCADMLVILRVEQMATRYAKKYLR